MLEAVAEVRETGKRIWKQSKKMACDIEGKRRRGKEVKQMR